MKQKQNCDAANAEFAKKFKTLARLIESGQIKLSSRDEVTVNLSTRQQAGKFFGSVAAVATFLQGQTANASSYRRHDSWGNTALVKTDGLTISFSNLQKE